MKTPTLVAIHNRPSPSEQQCSHHAPRDEQSSRGARRLHWRDGATVLEVVFAIGIVAVGLLGTLTIIPVAGHRVTQGTIADNADRAGRNAIRQFDVAQMGRPDMWTRFMTTSSSPPPPAQQYVPFTPTVTYPAFCIDPLFISKYVDNRASSGANVSLRTEFFPYYVVPTANVDFETRMRRISLRRFPGASHNLATPPGYNFQMGMSLDQAYQVFMTRDDLVFDLPDDRTEAPEQKFDDNDAKRQFDGKYTWMVTLSPKGLYYSSSLGNSEPLTDLYTLSFIVFYRRDMNMEMNYADPEKEGPDPERLVYADFRDTSGTLLPGAGIGGGNVRFETIGRFPPSSSHVIQDVEVRKGDWVMLSAKFLPNANTNLAPVSVFRWYRVLSADAATGDATNGFARTVTLLGPDWTDVISGQLRASLFPVAQATLLNGVVAVYEKTIRLEKSGMWTDL